MKKNRIRICGRKTSTLPAPAITPSTSRLRSGPSPMCAVVQSPSEAMPALIRSIGTLAQENTAWNIRKSTTARSARPQTGCITTASMRCWKRCSVIAPGAAMAMMRRTSFCSSADEGASSDATRASARGSVSPRWAASSASRPAWPSLFTATVSTTGQPSSAESLPTSICRPSLRATSAMFRATRSGRSRRFSSSTRRRFMRRLVASTTATMASGAASPCRRPSITSRVICSSGVAGVRL